MQMERYYPYAARATTTLISEFSPEHLAAHLNMIIVATRSRDIPSKPQLPLPARKELPTLGDQARDVAALELLQLGKGDAFEAEARRTRADREAASVGDSCAERQQQTDGAAR